MDMHTANTLYNPLPDFSYNADCGDGIREFLEKSERTLERESVLDQVIKLGDWIETCNRSQETACKVANDGVTRLHDMRNCLNQRADELMRLEGEGGLPSTPKQELEISELNRAVKRIDHVIGLIESKKAA